MFSIIHHIRIIVLFPPPKYSQPVLANAAAPGHGKIESFCRMLKPCLCVASMTEGRVEQSKRN